uniref:Glutathione peroxidase n=1 Tax=Hucho hucho TaxID=62062 RepID=A0A4W5L9F1_9TELE
MTLSDFSINDTHGKHIPLSCFNGQVLLISNTASECSFTKQYAELEALHQRYYSEGLIVIGFPCNQFGKQEPKSNDEILDFCQKNYGVTFLLSEKINVNGVHADPLWQWVTEEKPGIFATTQIKWNFSKFLIDRNGKVVGRYGPLTQPKKLSTHIEELLKQ